TPMMSARMLDKPPSHDENDPGLMNRIIRRYGEALDWVLARQPLAMAVMLGTIALTGVLYALVHKDFFPVQDSGVIQVVTEAPQTTSFTLMAERQQALAA